MSDFQNEDWGSSSFDEPVSKPKKSFKISKGVIIGAAIGVAVVGLVVFLCTNKTVKNAFMKAIKSDAEYYAWVEANYVEELANSATSIYGNYLLNAFDKKGIAISGSAELSADKDLLKEIYEVIEDNADIDVSKINKASATFDENIDMENGRAQVNMSASVNGDTIITIDSVVDMVEEMTYVKIPELSSYYLAQETSSAASMAVSRRSYNEMLEAWEYLSDGAYSELMKSLPSEKLVGKLIKKYAKVALAKVEDVDVDDVLLKDNGVSVKATSYTIEVDSDLLEEMFEAMQEEAVNDDDLIDAIFALANAPEAMGIDGADEVDRDDIVDGIENLFDEMIRAAEYDDEFEMTVYVNSKGEIVGREITTDDAETVGLYTLEEGREFSYKAFAILGYRNEEMGVTISGDKSGSRISGDLVYYMKGNSRTEEQSIITLKNFDVDKLKQGEISGTFVIDPADKLGKENWNRTVERAFDEIGLDSSSLVKRIKKATFEVTINASAKKVGVELALASGEDKLVSAAFNAAVSSASTVSEVTKYEEDAEDWLETCNVQGYLKKLRKTDLPDELIDLIEEGLDEVGFDY